MNRFFGFFRNQRFWLAGPLTTVVSMLCMLAMAVYFPPGVGNINNILMPLLMFPIIWACIFFYAYLTQHLKRAWFIIFTLGLINLAIIVLQFTLVKGS
ncbi:hypothetical protein PALB_35710 [Pseudoalteromonas luteoviolacea B = ATCC 29581]|nr:hypothetical protein PALB_35710 [Pseudoalteromonas luteoviolacea B = ATCC 29581]